MNARRFGPSETGASLQDKMKASAPLLGIVAMAVALCALPLASGAAGKDAAVDGAGALAKLYAPLEKAMGVDVVTSTIKLLLFTGEVRLDAISLTHPAQGEVIDVSKVSFPLGLITGSDPSIAKVTVGELHLAVDFGSDRFWVVKGGPVEGAPDLSVSEMMVTRGDVRLQDGASFGVVVEGFSGKLAKMVLPGEVWISGAVPDGKWATARISGGTVRLEGLPYEAVIERADVSFKGKTFVISQLVASMGSGTFIMSGKVKMAGGRPASWDLDLELEDVPVDTELVAGSLSGNLSVKGPAGKVKIAGNLELRDAGRFEAGKFALLACQGAPAVKVKLQNPGGKPGKLVLAGTLCQGKLTK